MLADIDTDEGGIQVVQRDREDQRARDEHDSYDDKDHI
jgi:hypothetical protein